MLSDVDVPVFVILRMTKSNPLGFEDFYQKIKIKCLGSKNSLL